MEISRKLANYLEGKKCGFYAAPFAVRLFEGAQDKPDDVQTVFGPDIAATCDRCKGAGQGKDQDSGLPMWFGRCFDFAECDAQSPQPIGGSLCLAASHARVAFPAYTRNLQRPGKPLAAFDSGVQPDIKYQSSRLKALRNPLYRYTPEKKEW